MQPFHHLSNYPELLEILSCKDTFQQEILHLRNSMKCIIDSRINVEKWRVLPLLPEEEDKTFVDEVELQKLRTLVPKTVSILKHKPFLKAYAFSLLEPGGHINPHRHLNPYVTASLCLEDGGNSYIRVENEKRRYKTGEILIFDYTMEHEVFNNGRNDRLVLLMLLENKMRNADGI